MPNLSKSRLILLLQTLNKKEIRDFRKFLKAPFFNQRSDVQKLYDFLAECLFEYDHIPDKEEIHQKVYQQTPYDDHQIRLILSFCFKHLERFLTYTAYFADEVKNKTKLAEVYRQRGLPKHFQRTIKTAREIYERRAIRNADAYNDYSQILLEEYQFRSTTQRTGAHNLQEISDNIDIAYFTQKLRQTCFSLSHQAVYKTEYRFGMLSEMLIYIEAQELLDIPAIAIYYHCYHALTQPGKRHYFEQLKTLLFRYPDIFPKVEIRDLFLLTINYCIKQRNAGEKNFEKELLDLYKEGLRQNHLTDNGVLSRFTYQNITTMGLIQEDYDWVEQFNYEYKDQLEKQYREPSFSYNMARLEYARKNYDHVLELLQKSNYKDLLLNLDAKTIALKTYFELREIALLESHMDAMKKFIRRKKIIGYHRENYLHLIQFTKQLLELPAYDRSGRKKLKQQILSTKAVAERVWLLTWIK